MSLFSRRLNIVTGKGGVGKSTVTAALALAAQARGLRVLCCEVNAKESVAGLLGAPDSGTEVRQVDRSIWTVHVRPPEAMREYGLMVLRFKTLYNAVFENRMVRYVLRAVPALSEIVMLGKVYWHVTQEQDEAGRPRWDLVLLDAPATGHGITFLRTPQDILGLISDGPMVRELKGMHAMITDPKVTATHIVSLPEEMPVNESVDLQRALSGIGVGPGRVFLNAFVERSFEPEELEFLHATDSAELLPSRMASRDWGARQAMSAFYEQRLQNEVGLPLTRLPYLASASFGRSEMERLAALLGEI